MCPFDSVQAAIYTIFRAEHAPLASILYFMGLEQDTSTPEKPAPLRPKCPEEGAGSSPISTV